MNHNFLLAGALCAVAGNAGAVEQDLTLRGNHVDYSAGFGQRDVTELEYVRRSDTTTVVVDAANGKRGAGDLSDTGTRIGAAVYHQWSPRVGTRSAVQWSDGSTVFVAHAFDQNLTAKLGTAYTGSIGLRDARYHGDVDVDAFYVEGARYFKAATLRARHTGYRVAGQGYSYANLMSLRVGDASGTGATTLWLGQGTALREYDWSAGVQSGRFHSVALQRLQPLGGPWSLRIGVDNVWYRTGAVNYQGHGLNASINARW